VPLPYSPDDNAPSTFQRYLPALTSKPSSLSTKQKAICQGCINLEPEVDKLGYSIEKLWERTEFQETDAEAMEVDLARLQDDMEEDRNKQILATREQKEKFDLLFEKIELLTQNLDLLKRKQDKQLIKSVQPNADNRIQKRYQLRSATKLHRSTV
jgi:hypothetical protein